jgi:hypothetical protein
MKKGTIEKFGLKAIADALKGSEVGSARAALSQLVGAAVDVSGKVQKRVRREEQFKLVIQPDDESGFVVFADFSEKLGILKKAKIRKGSSVSIRGEFQTFGASAVCLSDCRLEETAVTKEEQRRKRRLVPRARGNTQKLSPN